VLLRFLYLVGLAIGASSLLALLGGSYWAFDLFSHFRVQYVVLLIFFSGLLGFFKQTRQAGVIGSFAAFNLFLIAPLFLANSAHDGASLERSKLRVMSINLLSSNHEIEAVSRAVYAAKPKVVIFLEVNEWWHQELDAHLLSTYPFHESVPREDNFGISIYSQIPFTELQEVNLGSDVPSLLASFEYEETPFHLFAVHLLPPFGKRGTELRNAAFAQIPATIANLPHELLLVGDLNATPWSFPFRRLLAETALLDSSQGYGLQPTWPSFSTLLSIPIDHCLHTKGIVIVHREVGDDIGSDHFPLIVDFQLRTAQ